MDLEALFAELWYGTHRQGGSVVVAPPAAGGPTLQRQESLPQRPSLDQSVPSTAGSVADDEDDIAGLVPSALTVTTPPRGTWRRVFRYAVSTDSTAGSLPPSASAAASAAAAASGQPSPPPPAPIVPPLAAPAAAAAGGGGCAGCSTSEPSSPSGPLLGAAAGPGSGRSTPPMPPASPSDAAEALLMSGGASSRPEVAFPLGRAALVAVIKQTSFSAPPQARPEETLASAQSPPGGSATAQAAAACCPRAASVGAGRASAAPCGGPQRPHVPTWTSAFGGAQQAAAGAAALQSWPLPPAAGHLQQQQLSPLPLQQQQQASGEQQPEDEPESAESDATAVAACTPSDALAWRYRFTNKWRRARHVNAVDRFDYSPDPLAFIAAHGAATAVTLATNGGEQPAAVGLAQVLPPAGAAAGVGLPPLAAIPAPLPPAAVRQTARQSCAVAARFAAGAGVDACNSGASSLAGSWLPRVFSGGDMHRQLVAEAQRAHAALEQLSEAQKREQLLLQQQWRQRQQ